MDNKSWKEDKKGQKLFVLIICMYKFIELKGNAYLFL